MERGNGNTVLLTVIGVATLLVALVGATFAYFTASVTDSGNTGVVNVTTTQLSDLTITSAASTVTQPLYPGWVGYQKITVTAGGTSGSGASSKYRLDLKIGNGSSSALLGDVLYAACSSSTDADYANTAALYTAATAAVNTETTPNQYYMTGGVATLPSSGCTEIVADDAVFDSTTHRYTSGGTFLVNTTDKVLTSSATIAAGETQYYYVIYKYADKDSAQAQQGATFSVTPELTLLAQ